MQDKVYIQKSVILHISAHAACMKLLDDSVQIRNYQGRLYYSSVVESSLEIIHVLEIPAFSMSR